MKICRLQSIQLINVVIYKLWNFSQGLFFSESNLNRKFYFWNSFEKIFRSKLEILTTWTNCNKNYSIEYEDVCSLRRKLFEKSDEVVQFWLYFIYGVLHYNYMVVCTLYTICTVNPVCFDKLASCIIVYVHLIYENRKC